MTALPNWARQMQPVDMDGCALVLGISRRTLVDVIKKAGAIPGIKVVRHRTDDGRIRIYEGITLR